MTHPSVAAVSFTGSTETGRLVNQACASTFKPCHLEMGGKNIMIVMDDANLDLAVEGAVWGGFGTSGQRCTAASRVAVHHKVYGRFLESFTARASALKLGNGLEPETEMGPVVNETQLQTVMKYVQIGKDENAKLRLATEEIAPSPGNWPKVGIIEPTIFGDVDPAMRIAQEEIFGPVVSVIPFESFDEAIEIANNVIYGLSASIYTAQRESGLRRHARH